MGDACLATCSHDTITLRKLWSFEVAMSDPTPPGYSKTLKLSACKMQMFYSIGVLDINGMGLIFICHHDSPDILNAEPLLYFA